MVTVADVSKTKLLKMLQKAYPGKYGSPETRIRSLLREGKISPREALSRMVDVKLARLVKKRREEEQERIRRVNRGYARIVETLEVGEWKVTVAETDWVLPLYLNTRIATPAIYVNRGKKEALVVLRKGTYSSTRYWNGLFSHILDTQPTETGFAILVMCVVSKSLQKYETVSRPIAFIAGYDDGSTFVERVPPRVKSVREALAWMRPAEVRKAEQEGRQVYRQGDVFFVELRTKARKITDYSLPANHQVEVNGKVLVKHYEHSTLELPHPHFKPVRRKTVWGAVSD